MPLFSSGKKNPAELVKALHESLNIISKEQSGKKNEKVLIPKKIPMVLLNISTLVQFYNNFDFVIFYTL